MSQSMGQPICSFAFFGALLYVPETERYDAIALLIAMHQMHVHSRHILEDLVSSILFGTLFDLFAGCDMCWVSG